MSKIFSCDEHITVFYKEEDTFCIKKKIICNIINVTEIEVGRLSITYRFHNEFRTERVLNEIFYKTPEDCIKYELRHLEYEYNKNKSLIENMKVK